MTTIRVTLNDETRRLYDEINRLSQERFMRQIGGQSNTTGTRVRSSHRENC